MKKLLNLLKVIAIIGTLVCVLIAAWYAAILLAILFAAFVVYYLITYADQLEEEDSL